MIQTFLKMENVMNMTTDDTLLDLDDKEIVAEEIQVDETTENELVEEIQEQHKAASETDKDDIEYLGAIYLTTSEETKLENVQMYLYFLLSEDNRKAFVLSDYPFCDDWLITSVGNKIDAMNKNVDYTKIIDKVNLLTKKEAQQISEKLIDIPNISRFAKETLLISLSS